MVKDKKKKERKKVVKKIKHILILLISILMQKNDHNELIQFNNDSILKPETKAVKC